MLNTVNVNSRIRGVDWRSCTIIWLLCPHRALALDTIKTWKAGATNVEMYVGVEQATKRAISGRILLGHGIDDDDLAAYLCTHLSGANQVGGAP
ncbi:hypothetical protein ACFL6C_13760 [Myxococcota bacterium]